jgi:hypothetical protein
MPLESQKKKIKLTKEFYKIPPPIIKLYKLRFNQKIKNILCQKLSELILVPQIRALP